MKLILFGDIPNWNRSLQLLQTYRPDIFIAGLSSVSLGQFASSSVTYTPEETATLYRSHQIDGVINIQGENPYYFRLLKELGIENIYVIPHTLYQKLELSESIDGDAILYPYKEVLPELMQLEFHLADHCNLNCKGCSHFSNLVPQPVFPDKEQFVRDLQQLTGYFSQIHVLSARRRTVIKPGNRCLHQHCTQSISLYESDYCHKRTASSLLKGRSHSDDQRKSCTHQHFRLYLP